MRVRAGRWTVVRRAPYVTAMARAALIASTLLAIGIARVMHARDTQSPAPARAGNPVFDGWYADPEGVVFGDRYWIYPDLLRPVRRADLHGLLLVAGPRDVDEARADPRHQRASSGRSGRCGRRRSSRRTASTTCSSAPTTSRTTRSSAASAWPSPTSPEGPFKDHLGKPLVDKFHNGAQPIDQFVFKDKDGQHYLIYGGWRHCNIAKLNDDFTGFVPFDGRHDVPGDHAGAVRRRAVHVPARTASTTSCGRRAAGRARTTRVAYAIADSPFGPFERIGKVLQQDPAIATGAGHHSVIHVPGDDDAWYIVYHRRPKGLSGANQRVTCIDRMTFDDGRADQAGEDHDRRRGGEPAGGTRAVTVGGPADHFPMQ